MGLFFLLRNTAVHHYFSSEVLAGFIDINTSMQRTRVINHLENKDQNHSSEAEIPGKPRMKCKNRSDACIYCLIADWVEYYKAGTGMRQGLPASLKWKSLRERLSPGKES